LAKGVGSEIEMSENDVAIGTPCAIIIYKSIHPNENESVTYKEALTN
jgi:hypothetical protein